MPFLHVFPYSARSGTPAARMPAVPMAVRRERAARLRATGEAAAGRFFASRVGAGLSVLTESGDAGHCEHFAPVRLTRPAEPGQVIAARGVSADARGILAEPV